MIGRRPPRRDKREAKHQAEILLTTHNARLKLATKADKRLVAILKTTQSVPLKPAIKADKRQAVISQTTGKKLPRPVEWAGNIATVEVDRVAIANSSC